MFADWEYGVGLEAWDKKVTHDIVMERLTAFHMINSNKNAVTFNWCHYLDMATLHTAYQLLGYTHITDWPCLNMYKNQVVSGQHYVHVNDQAIVAMRGVAMRRQTSLDDAKSPFAMSNISLVTEAPRPPKDLTGASVNRAFKSWQGPADFLGQWGTNEGWVFSMMDGMGAVAQAVAYLGSYNAVCVEKDPKVWRAACDNLAKWLVSLEKMVLFFGLT